jgi:hypothetical protein
MTDNIAQAIGHIYEQCVIKMQNMIKTPSALQYTNFCQWLEARYHPHSDAHCKLVLHMQQVDTKVASVLGISLHRSATA